MADTTVSVSDVRGRLEAARSLEEVQAIVRTSARRLMHADGATLVLREGQCCFYVDEDAMSPLWKGQRFPLTQCISGWSMLNRDVAVIPDITLDERIPQEAYRPTFVKSLVMVPIRAADPIGAIGAYWARTHRAPDSDVEQLRDLAEATGTALDRFPSPEPPPFGSHR